MPSWYGTSTLYKGLFVILIVLIACEYFFGTIQTHTKEYFSYEPIGGPTIPQTGVQTIHSPIINPIVQFKQRDDNDNYSANSNSNNDNKKMAEPQVAKAPVITNNNKNISVGGNNNNNRTSTERAATEAVITSNGTTVTEYVNVTQKPAEKAAAKTSEPVKPTEATVATPSTPLPLCPEVPPNLAGRLKVAKTPVPSVMDLERDYSWLEKGGHWKPNDCRVTQKLAIIVPFRCRGEHLLLFLQHIHPFLKRQLLDYRIFVIEQDGNDTFNRAMLMNVGFVEAMKLVQYDCFIFHDVDLIPEDDHNMYTCPEQPRHMSVAVDELKYRLPYPSIFGGVSALSTEHFKLVNGFSNMYWGWGGEDDDMSNRIKFHKLHISRYPAPIARYTMLTHKKDTPNPKRYDLLKNGEKNYGTDGLNSLKYKLLQMKENRLYTWFLVALNRTTS